MINITLMNPSYDLVYKIPESGRETYVDLPARLYPAGKGVNAAKTAAALGEPVRVYSIMPEGDASHFTSYLESRDIEHIITAIPGTVRINTTIYDESSRGTTHYNSAGSRLSAQVQEQYRKKIVPLIKADDYWLFTGSIPVGIDSTFYGEMIRECRDRGAYALLDSRGEALKRGAAEHPLLISPNQEELESLYAEPVDGIQHLALKGKRLIDSGVKMVFITLGEDGVIALHENECIMCRPPEVDVVDTVGCGDAFLAGAAVGISRGFSFHEICRLAAACGASNASQFGPGEIDSAQVWHLMENSTVVHL